MEYQPPSSLTWASTKGGEMSTFDTDSCMDRCIPYAGEVMFIDHIIVPADINYFAVVVHGIFFLV